MTGAAGSGRSRLAAEAVPEAMCEQVCVVDDAHLLDDASANLVHDLALSGRTRLLVTVREGEPVPEGVSRLWEENLLPRLVLAPLTESACAELLKRAVGGYVDALTVRRLYRASCGDLRLLRELVVAVHAGGDLSHVSGTWTWRGTPPMTARVRELVEETIRDVDEEERYALELVASGEPPGAGVPGALVAPAVLEHLRVKGLVTVDDRLAVRLAHPLHGPVLRAAAERPLAAGLPAGDGPRGPRCWRPSARNWPHARTREGSRRYLGASASGWPRTTPAGTSPRCRSSARSAPASPGSAGRPARPWPGAARDCAVLPTTAPAWPNSPTPPPTSAT